MEDAVRTRVWVTRPSPDAGVWVDHLRHKGFDAQALPLIEIAPIDDVAGIAALQTVWKELGSYTACMFVSGNAVTQFFKLKEAVAGESSWVSAINSIANDSRRSVPARLRLLAPGPGTAGALLAAGVPTAQIDAPPTDSPQFDSEALWQLVGKRDWQGCRVLVVRGRGRGDSPAGPNHPADASGLAGDGVSSGRDWLSRQWHAAGASIDTLSVYERRAPNMSVEQLDQVKAAAQDGSVWLFSSSEAVANLAAQAGLNGMDWRGARAIATHPRIAEAVRAAGWGVVVESRPALGDIIATLRSIESAYP